jgi:circadian clock protein KaiB
MTALLGPDPKARPGVLRLYVAGATPNSVRAQHNLAAGLAASPFADRFAVEIIDVFDEPKKAMKDEVLVTPTLIAFDDGRRVVIVGDLADLAPLHGLLAAARLGEARFEPDSPREPEAATDSETASA